MRNSDAPRGPKPLRRPAARSSHDRRRDDFFRRQLDAEQLLQAFDHLPGILYFVKDAQSRLMAISGESVARMGFKTKEEILGRPVHEYLPPELADKYFTDDQWVIRHGKPLRNMVEMWFNEQGFRDWIITDKYPLRDARGKVVGLIGTIQTFEARRKLLAHLGPVGKAADFIRDRPPCRTFGTAVAKAVPPGLRPDHAAIHHSVAHPGRHPRPDSLRAIHRRDRRDVWLQRSKRLHQQAARSDRPAPAPLPRALRRQAHALIRSASGFFV